MKVSFRYIFLLAIFIRPGIYVSEAQLRFDEEVYLRANYHCGFVLPEYQHFIYIVDDNINSLELSLSKQTTGKNLWEEIYNYPEYGLSLFYSTLGNDDIFGREAGIYPFVLMHIINKKRFQFNNKVGIGISYVSKKFDMEENYQNVSVGSKANVHFNFEIGVKYQVLDNIFINSGIAFNHFSNANFQEPNLGINCITFFGGLNYLAGKKLDRIKQNMGKHEPFNEFSLIYSIGGKHIGALQTDVYYTSSLSFEFKRRLFRVFYLGIGTDLFYDSGTKIEMRSQGREDIRPSDDFRSGVHLSEEFVYNKMSIVIQEGLYMILRDRVDHYVMYNRAIFRYKISSRFSVNIAMKSHIHILDYPEVGFGYHW